MRYEELVDLIAEQSDQSPKAVREVLFALPDALVLLKEKEQVRLPFGVFRMTRRKARSVTIPTSDIEVDVPSLMVVKLKPGSRLRR